MLRLESQLILEQKPEAGISSLRDSDCSSRFSGFIGYSQMKTCSKCHEEKEFVEFNKNRTTKDGYQFHCRDCQRVACRIYSARYRTTAQGKANIAQYQQSEKYKSYRKLYQQTDIAKSHQRRYRQSPKGKESTRKAYIAYRRRNPNKVKAGNAVRHAVASGKMPQVTTLKCNRCPNQAQEYHHWSYLPEFWLDVEPICKKCHKKVKAVLYE